MPDAYYDRISAVLTGASRQPVWTPDVQAVGSASPNRPASISLDEAYERASAPWRETCRASGGGLAGSGNGGTVYIALAAQPTDHPRHSLTPAAAR